jgi:septum formation protein
MPYRMAGNAIGLASASPRRSELLRQIGVAFRVVHAPVDEARAADEDAEDYVTRLAAAKAEAGWHSLDGASRIPVLGADTVVLLDRLILGKPAGRDDALWMLEQLSGRTHSVLTAVALRDSGGQSVRINRSRVKFRTLTPAERATYWDTGEPVGKAGAYAIQGFGACFVEDLQGSYSGVMGLPLFETAQLLDDAAIARWQSA